MDVKSIERQKFRRTEKIMWRWELRNYGSLENIEKIY